MPPDEPTLIEPGQWPVETRRAMDQLAAGLRDHATELPVVYYAEYVDLWSMFDVFRGGFPEDGSPLYEVMSGDGGSLLCYELPDGGALRRHLERQRRRRSVAEESRWFLRQLQQASEAWSQVVSESCIVVVRRVVGGLVEDQEVGTAARRVTAWLERAKMQGRGD